MNVPLGNGDAAMAGNPHDREGFDAGFPQAGQHGVPQRVYHEVFGELLRRPNLLMLVV